MVLMGEVSVRELHQDTAGVLARVKRGEEVDLTEDGVRIARLVPAAPSPLHHLLAGGNLRLPALTGPIPPPGGPVRGDHEAGESLRERRDDERY